MFTNSGITAAYFGSLSVSKMYFGDVLVWPLGKDYSTEYFTMEFISGGTVNFYRSNGPEDVAVQYSLNNGEWTTLHSVSASTVNVNAGDIMKWRGTVSAFGSAEGQSSRFGGTAIFKAYGNVMSLTKGDNFQSAQLTNNFELEAVLCGSYVTDAENLVFPEGNVPRRALDQFFQDCSKLITGPKTLPATTLANDACGHMFRRCGNMTTAPTMCATTIGGNAMNGMFENCSSITKFIFENPISSFGSYACHYCFNNCKALECMEANLAAGVTSARPGTWMPNVKATGTFVTNNSSAWLTGTAGIPNNWSVIEI